MDWGRAVRGMGVHEMNSDTFLSNVKWEPLAGDAPADESIPWATHRGVLRINGSELECFRLSNGQAVFEANSFRKFLDEWFGGPIIDAKDRP